MKELLTEGLQSLADNIPSNYNMRDLSIGLVKPTSEEGLQTH
jgi:hypothetical protein